MHPHRIAVGDGSPEGTNSAYVLPDHGAVIDPGPPGEDSWQRLISELTDSVSLSEISAVFVTHWHMDHAGLAPRLAEATGGTLYMHEDDAPVVGEYATQRTRRLDHDARTLAQWGVPTDRIDAIQSTDATTPVPDAYPVRRLSDGDHAGKGVEVLHTPGHTLGHAAFGADGTLFVGDAVLPTYTPNVGGSDTRTETPLETYLSTLGRLRSRSETAYPGHGADLDLKSRIDEIRDHHERRSRRIHALVVKHERVTPWDVATRLFGEMHGIHAKMGAGEAAAHLIHLDAREYVEQIADDPATFAPTRTDQGDCLLGDFHGK